MTPLYFLLVRTGPFRRHVLATYTLMGGFVFFVAASSMAELGGPDRPWIYFSYVFPFATVTLPLPPKPRALLTGVFAVFTVAGCFALRPAHLASPFAPMMLSFFVCIILV